MPRKNLLPRSAGGRRFTPGRRRGTIVVLAALLMIVLLTFIALSLDTGYLCLARTQLQNAADAAALAGAAKLAEGPAAARLECRSYASANVVAGRTLEIIDDDVEVGRWDEELAIFEPLDPTNQSLANAVRVTCPLRVDRGNPLRLFFASISGHGQAELVASATARFKNARLGLLVGLDSVTMTDACYTDSFQSDLAPYNDANPGANGHICSNGMITLTGTAAVHGNGYIGPAATVNSSSGVGVTGQVAQLSSPASYSPVNPDSAVWDNNNGFIPSSDLGVQPLDAAGGFTLSGGDNVELPPGTYHFSKLVLSGGSTLRVSGQTVVYVVEECDLSGGSLINDTQLAKNLQLFPLGTTCSLAGNSEFFGVVYCPQADVEWVGDGDFHGAIIARNLVLGGNGGIHADESLDFSYLDSGNPKSSLVD